MYKSRLCLGTNSQFGISTKKQIELFKQTGFDGFFTDWDSEIMEYRRLADKIDMIYQSVHAPFGNASKMWKNNKESENAVNELISCVRDCAEAEVPIMIVHTYIGFDSEDIPTKEGIDNFGRVVEEADKLNVKIAFENTEGEEYLKAVMDAFSHCDNVGFCWDSGHEMCYNKGKDMLNLYGDRLIATHLNDNLGVSDFDGKIFWTDDLHLLPFDGIINWENAVKRLNICGYDDIITFELNTISKPNRHENDKYKKMPIEEYVAECYVRACKVAYMKNENNPHL